MIHLRNLKHTLNHGLLLKKFHKVIKFNQNAWLKSYIDMNTELTKNVKNDFKKDFCEPMYNVVFRKTMENVRNHRGIKLVTNEERRNSFVSEPKYTTTFFSKIFSSDANKQAYLGLSTLGMSKTVIYEFLVWLRKSNE